MKAFKINKRTLVKTIFATYFELDKIIENIDKLIVKKCCINYSTFEIEKEFNNIVNLIDKKVEIINFAKLAEKFFIALDKNTIKILYLYLIKHLTPLQISEIVKMSARNVDRKINLACLRCFSRMEAWGYDISKLESILTESMWLRTYYNNQNEVLCGKIHALEKRNKH